MTRRLLPLLLAPLLGLTACQTTPTPPPVEPVVPVVTPPAPPKVGLVLGGGGARGFAHIGVLKMLDVLGVKPDLIVGTSAGSVAGAFYAAGYNGFDLQQMAFDLDRATVSDWTMFGKGLLRGDALQNFVNRLLGNRNIEQLKIPFAAVAARLDNGQGVLFQRGNVGQAVRASSAVPGVFQPTLINNVEYVDGGLVSPVPIRYARQLGADFIIAVDVSTPPSTAATESKLDVVMRTFDIMGKAMREAELPLADVVIRPDLSQVSSTDFENKQLAILQGERAAAAAVPVIRDKLLARMKPAPATPVLPAGPSAQTGSAPR
ncbi:MAG TPA: patatin-like phospholipase family protein [Solimonas sp.]|nr:patatin-like phospholipase family protein [Solimonas sp.]